MSDLVSRLAAKWRYEADGHATCADDARWWLAAIAEELEDTAMRDWKMPTDVGFEAAKWLRSQIQASE